MHDLMVTVHSYLSRLYLHRTHTNDYTNLPKPFLLPKQIPPSLPWQPGCIKIEIAHLKLPQLTIGSVIR